MRRITKLMSSGLLMIGIVNAQITDEGNVTLYLDLQPVLQLKVEGPSEITFTFDQIYKYYGGIIKYGATILKVSSTVTWDLWAAGISQGNSPCGTPQYCWDVMMQYSTTNGVPQIPLTAVELRQYPTNPSTRATGVPIGQGGFGATCANVVAPSSDYSNPFSQYDPLTNTFTTLVDNLLYVPDPAGTNGPYTPPTSSATATTTEKYIAGATGQAAAATGDCGIPGGSYLTYGGLPGPNSLFYYVIDYRILPGLPVRFPAHLLANAANSGATYVTNADAAAGYTANPQQFARPGVYTMNVKYILTEDQ